MKMQYFLAIVLVSVQVGLAYGTCHQHDTVRHKGTEFKILSDPLNSCTRAAYPLEGYFVANESAVSKIKAFFDKYYIEEKEEGEFTPVCGSPSAYSPGYIAKWEIQNDRFYLTQITVSSGCYSGLIPLKVLFPKNVITKLADWYSGVIYIHKTHDRGLSLKICNGIVISESEFVFEDFDGYDMGRAYHANALESLKKNCPTLGR